MRSPLRAASAALAVTLLVAACGSDDSGTGASDGATPTIESVDTTVEGSMPEPTTADTTSPATSVPEEEGQDVEADTAAAEAALLTVADLPEGWTEAPRDADTSALDSRLAECVDGDEVAAAEATAASSLLVAADGTLSLTEDIDVYATERDARSVVAFTTEPAVPTCFAEAYAELAAEVFAGSLAEGAAVGVPVAARLQVGSAGDATQAIRVVVPVTGDPTVTAITVDHVLVRGGRALSSLTFDSRAAATAIETIDEITALVAANLQV